MHIAERVIQRPVAVCMSYLAVLLLGGISLSRIPVDLLPDLSYPKLTVQTEYSDAPPEEVERLISQSIERVMANVPGLRRISSVSREGLSVVTLEFTWGQNMDFAALHVRENLDRLGRMPEGAEDPVVIRLDPSSQPFMGLSVTGSDLPHLADLSRNVFKRRLEQIDGVALAQVTGGPRREIQVDLDPEKMEHLGLTVAEVAASINQANRDLPGGTLLRGRYRFSLRTLGAFQSLQDIGNVVIWRGDGGNKVLLQDLAEIRDGFREKTAITRYNGEESIGLLLQKEADANTVQVSGIVKKVLQQLRTQYPEVTIAVAYNQAEFIQQAITNLLLAILLGGVLAFLVLFIFLHDARHPLAVGVAIPIAIVATFMLLHFTGVTLNLMSLGGLALGVGMLVDASIVVLENIFRHHEEGANIQAAAASGTKEVAMAVTASTFTTIAVFLPVLYVKGVAGQLFRDQALTVTFSLLSSLIVSLTLLPVMAARFRKISDLPDDRGYFKRENQASIWRSHRLLFWISRPFRLLRDGFNFLIIDGLRQMGRAVSRVAGLLAKAISRSLKPLFEQTDRILARALAFYEKVLERALERRALTLGLLGLVLVLTFFIAKGLDRQLLPVVDQGEFLISLRLLPGASLEAVAESAARMEDLLLNNPSVADVFTNIGRVEGEESENADLNQAKMRVLLKRGRSTRSVMEELRHSTSMIAAEVTMEGSQSVLGQLLGQVGGEVEIQLIGNDLETNIGLVDSVKALLEGTGLGEVTSVDDWSRPEIRLEIDRRKAGLYQLSIFQVAAFIRNQVAGSVATQYKAFDQKIDVLVRPLHAEGISLPDLLDRRIPAGISSVPLREFVRASTGRGTTAIRRENQARIVLLKARLEKGGLGQAMALAQKRLAPLSSDRMRIEIGGTRTEMSESYGSLAMAAALAAALVFMIMAAQFESLRHPFVILLSVPMGVIGSVWLLFLTGQSINVISLIGLVVLVGIAVNDAIVKVDFINQRRREGMPLRQALLDAGRKRFRPIIMTSLTTILGLLPLAIGLGRGAELQRPLALAIIGGLITSTILTLICIPVIYSLMDKEKLQMTGGEEPGS